LDVRHVYAMISTKAIRWILFFTGGIVGGGIGFYIACWLRMRALGVINGEANHSQTIDIVGAGMLGGLCGSAILPLAVFLVLKMWRE
jgi:hypothetical protein